MLGNGDKVVNYLSIILLVFELLSLKGPAIFFVFDICSSVYSLALKEPTKMSFFVELFKTYFVEKKHDKYAKYEMIGKQLRVTGDLPNSLYLSLI